MSPVMAYLLGISTTMILVFVAARIAGYSWFDPLPRSGLTILAVWLANLAFSYGTNVTDGWLFNLGVDSIAAFVILLRPAGRGQALLGVSFCAQIAMHLGYGTHFLTGTEPDQWAYYDALTRVAWVQLLLLGGWGCGEIWRTVRDRGGAGHPEDAAVPGLPGVGGAR